MTDIEYSREAVDAVLREIAEIDQVLQSEPSYQETHASLTRRIEAIKEANRLLQIAHGEALETHRKKMGLTQQEMAVLDHVQRVNRTVALYEAREKAIQTNLIFWQCLTIELDKDQVKDEMDKLPLTERFNWYFFVPAKVTFGHLWKTMQEVFHAVSIEGELEAGILSLQTERPYAFAARYGQEADWESLGTDAKSGQEWSVRKEKFMNPLERLVAELQWYGKNRCHLDLQYITLCSGQRLVRESAGLYFLFNAGELWPTMTSCLPDFHDQLVGIRQIIATI